MNYLTHYFSPIAPFATTGHKIIFCAMQNNFVKYTTHCWISILWKSDAACHDVSSKSCRDQHGDRTSASSLSTIIGYAFVGSHALGPWSRQCHVEQRIRQIRFASARWRQMQVRSSSSVHWHVVARTRMLSGVRIPGIRLDAAVMRRVGQAIIGCSTQANRCAHNQSVTRRGQHQVMGGEVYCRVRSPSFGLRG